MKVLKIASVALFVVTTYLYAAGELPQNVRIIPAQEWNVAPATMLVPVSSIMVVAPRKTDALPWVVGSSYRNGDIVKSTNNSSRLYWCGTMVTNRYTAATCPSHHRDAVTYDTNLRWVRIPPYIRNGINITNADDENEVWLALSDGPAFVNQGILLQPGQSWWVDGTWYQGGIWAISYASTNRLVIQEF